VGAGAVALVFLLTIKFCLFKIVFFLGRVIPGFDAFLAMSHSGNVVPGLVVLGLVVPVLVVPGSVGVPKFTVQRKKYHATVRKQFKLVIDLNCNDVLVQILFSSATVDTHC
jgi:hypothetical protein